MRLLTQLLDALFVPRESELLLRELPHDALSTHLSPHTLELEGLDVITLTRYDEPLMRAAIIEAKFHGNVQAIRLLASLLSEYVFEMSIEYRSFEQCRMILVPVPLSPQRRAQRGYNQAEVIARKALAYTPEDIALFPNALTRIRDTLPQTTLNGNLRRQNMRTAFVATQPLDPAIRYILLDDVVTTGATISAAATALWKAGARTILPLALAH